MHGSVDGLIEDSSENLARLADWLRESDAQAALLELDAAERNVETAKNHLAEVKQKFAAILAGRQDERIFK
ncbi:hypothetical protein A9R05_04645 [Burkholderia sp. KK1]|nr:hypothetical protein A9R05_04645 [Burkholderia sp. KK1]